MRWSQGSNTWETDNLSIPLNWRFKHTKLILQKRRNTTWETDILSSPLNWWFKNSNTDIGLTMSSKSPKFEDHGKQHAYDKHTNKTKEISASSLLLQLQWHDIIVFGLQLFHFLLQLFVFSFQLYILLDQLPLEHQVYFLYVLNKLVTFLSNYWLTPLSLRPVHNILQIQ